MLQILHLEDVESDATLVKQALTDSGLDARIKVVTTRGDFVSALRSEEIDMVFSDSSVPGFDGVEALNIARSQFPQVPFITVSGTHSESRARAALAAGANAYVSKDQLWELKPLVKAHQEGVQLQRANRGMSRLVDAVQELSLARNLESIMAIVRKAARELTGADGATFVLRKDDCCYYADENAISPLWKGQKFPLKLCISGWVMLNAKSAVIEDIYADPRIPAEAYRPTFVKSLAMVPIRSESPIGAIGNYWAKQRMPTAAEVELLQALANTTAVAMENVRVYEELEKRVADRTVELEAANRDLESFSYAVSHDLRAPLRSIRGFSDILSESAAEQLDAENLKHLDRIRTSSDKMAALIEDLLRLANYSRSPLHREPVNLSALVRSTLTHLAESSPERKVEVRVAENVIVDGDAGLLRAAFENLLSNAWKYSSKQANSKIEFGVESRSGGTVVCFVRDNGAGFDSNYQHKLFQPFQRLHSEKEFAGTGIGLATVKRILQRHGAEIWAESKLDQGATFYVKFGANPASRAV